MVPKLSVPSDPLKPDAEVILVEVIVDAVIWLAVVVQETSTPPPTVRFPETLPVVAWRLPTVTLLLDVKEFCLPAKPLVNAVVAAFASKAVCKSADSAVLRLASATQGAEASRALTSDWLKIFGADSSPPRARVVDTYALLLIRIVYRGSALTPRDQ